MPVVTFEAGPMDTALKMALIQQRTATAAGISGIPAQAFSIVIREHPYENLGMGGETVKEIKERHAGERGAK